ncbi:hypothetical protein ACOMHN_033781 [Nucella lapillus]
MALENYIPLLRFVGTLVTPVLYIVSFASKRWVTMWDREWGLWGWCYTNVSSQDAAASNLTKCHVIRPGDSPGYYEGVRTIACFMLVVHLLYFCTTNHREGMGKTKQPCCIALAACIGLVITLGLLGGNYKDDDRWKDLDPSLGWCFWTTAACAIMDFLLIGVFWKFDEMNNKNTVSQSPTRNPPQRRSSNARPVTLEAERKVPIFRTSLADGAAGTSHSPQRSSGESASSPRSHSFVNWRVSGGGDGGRFPVLTLPRYDIPSEPGVGHPYVPPPSYEDVVTRGDVLSPPPPYTVEAAAAEHRDG